MSGRPGPELEEIAARYRRFAAVEADGISPLYAALARAVAGDRATLARLLALPGSRRQPNLLFAAHRTAIGRIPDDPRSFLIDLAARWPEIEAVLTARRNQMNEAGRCGVLLPALATIEGPLSLIEIGASAGLCLLPDRYRYRWHRPDGSVHALDPTPVAPAAVPEIELPVEGPAPLPDRMPEIAWRAGLDLDPVDLEDPVDRAWLEALIWPEHTHRAERLRAAIAVARSDPPPIVVGDLRADLAALVDRAPGGTTVVVFHTAVLAYLGGRAEIDEVATTIDRLGVRWISNESPRVFPEANRGREAELGRDFSLMVDGVPVAATGPHGQSLRWFAPST